ncbi:MAG: hypothetical protein JO342_05275 [Solirubrobacterales bacterium]|nr:hypothetical protein [Solirubrobacterales bacterium]
MQGEQVILSRFEARLLRRPLAIAERDLAVGGRVERAHRERLAWLGFHNDAFLAAAIRSGRIGPGAFRIIATLHAPRRRARPHRLP